MTSLATWPMYVTPEPVREAGQIFIERVLAHLGIQQCEEAPADLMAQWSSPSLLLSQSCGYPVMTRLRDKVQIVATPCYELSGCEGAQHRSFIVVHADDERSTLEAFRGARVVINALDSNSGMNLLRVTVAPMAEKGRFFGEVKASGAHVTSLELLSRGETELTAIDCVTWGYLERYAPDTLARTRVLARTELTPALPIITAASRSLEEVQQMQHVLNEILQEQPALAETLAIRSFVPASLDDYRVILAQRDRAMAAGYPIIA
ncbi:phosphate/phosphite/phosphonate ABC transporter substrate-binding protein [Pseudomonas luteola]|uniref:phosphate/phosphite/phosphonate ABC transporter substrate-binding protein n=1 Tax=Pseudomonas luteola TaxID=47886 RepID=UPI0028A15B33|nr:PhnD/SsuA/transferrin family substrate-binding protein [Pseudomonas luteola]